MSRKLDIKKGDVVLVKIESMSNASRGMQPFSLDTFDKWVKEMVVVSTGKKYITVGNVSNPSHKWTQIKFEVDNDYREHYTCGGADYKLYESKQEILDEMEYNSIYSSINSIFHRYGDGYGSCALSLDQLRRIKSIIEEVKV